MKMSKEERQGLIEAVETQIKLNNPPETKQTFERLRDLGYNDYDSKALISQCISIEMFEIIQDGEPFNPKRYAKNLAKLPGSLF